MEQSFLDRTEKGQEEIRHRKYKLASKARMLLLLVDGKHTFGELRTQAEKIGLNESTLADLIEQGFLAPVNSVSLSSATATSSGGAAPGAGSPGEAAGQTTETYDQYRKAYEFMNESVVSALGLKSFFFTLKIEKTSNLEDLRALLVDYSAAMRKALGEGKAEPFVSRMQQLLA